MEVCRGGVYADLSMKALHLRLFLFAASLLFALVVFEAVCRMLSVDFNPYPQWRFHPTLGWTQERAKEYEVSYEGEVVHVEFNSRGFRDVEHGLEKPEGVKRIVLIGDSFSEALQVNLEETFWRRLQRLLNGNQQKGWEVINLGVGDFGNAQALLALTELGFAYSPDIVLLQIFPLNDICNNSMELAGLCKSENDDYRPYFVETVDGLQLTWNHPLRHKLRRRFVSFGVLEKAWIMIWRQFENRKAKELHKIRYQEQGWQASPLLYTYVGNAHQIGPMARAWQVTEAILTETHSVCRKRGIPLLPIVIPFEIRVSPRWAKFALSFPNLDMEQDYPEQRLGCLFEELGIPSVLLKPIFERYLELVLPGRAGHMNPATHRLVARSIYEKLLESGLVQ